MNEANNLFWFGASARLLFGNLFPEFNSQEPYQTNKKDAIEYGIQIN